MVLPLTGCSLRSFINATARTSALVLSALALGIAGSGCTEHCPDGSVPKSDCLCPDGTKVTGCKRDVAPTKDCSQDDRDGHINLANEVEDGSSFEGAICTGEDEDYYRLTGKDGKGSFVLEVENRSKDGPLVVTVFSGLEEIESFEAPPEASGKLTVGSRVGREHRFRVSARSGPIRYAVLSDFSDDYYELESNSHVNSANRIDSAVPWFGRIRDGNDTDWFSIPGADGKGNLKIDIKDLGQGPEDAKLKVTVFNGLTQVESFSVGHGELGSLTVGSALNRDHRIGLSADKGPVGYSIAATLGDELYELEDNGHINAAQPMRAGRTYRGRVATTGDTDWFRIPGEDGAANLKITATPEGGGTLNVAIFNNLAEVSRHKMRAGDAPLDVPSTFNRDHRISLSAEDGTPLRYSLEASFNK